jgi:hypothetical protein
MGLIAGFALLGVGLFAWLLGTHFRERRWFDRPDVARHRLFDPLLAAARWMLLAVGLVVLWRASPRAAGAAAALLLLLTCWRRTIRSVPVRRWLVRRRFEELRRARPGSPEREILERLVLERHPEWGEELVAQMVLDYRTPDELARVMARMERGFRGFR